MKVKNCTHVFSLYLIFLAQFDPTFGSSVGRALDFKSKGSQVEPCLRQYFFFVIFACSIFGLIIHFYIFFTNAHRYFSHVFACFSMWFEKTQFLIFEKKNCPNFDSNQEPLGLKSDALPTELSLFPKGISKNLR